MSEYVEVPLTKGLVAFIDEADAPLVLSYKWHAAAKADNRSAYAKRALPNINGKKQGSIYLHNFLVNPPEGLWVDHINRNGLDCRRSNMRVATRAENNRNAIRSFGKNLYRGVRRSNGNRFKIWFASISFDGVEHTRGSFNTQEEAALAYDAMAVQFHGEFAVLNFPERRTDAFRAAQERIARDREDVCRFLFLAEKSEDPDEFRRMIDAERLGQ